MESRSIDIIRKDLEAVINALDLCRQIPCVAAYLAESANSKTLPNNNGFDNRQILIYNDLLSIKQKLDKELKLARDEKFYNQIASCKHIFYTGADKHGHVVTTCLCCGVSSDQFKHEGLSEYYMNQLNPILINLFFYGEYLNYPTTSGAFSALEEAQHYYNKATEPDENNPQEEKESDSQSTVNRMLELKNYDRRY